MFEAVLNCQMGWCYPSPPHPPPRPLPRLPSVEFLEIQRQHSPTLSTSTSRWPLLAAGPLGWILRFLLTSHILSRDKTSL